MPRGRPRKSAREKLLEGSRAKISVEIFKPVGLPFVPEHLSDDAQTCAEHIIKNFSAKHISSIDSYALAVFATAWAWHKRAVRVMSSPDFQPVETRTYKNQITRRLPSPWFKILNEQARLMNSIAPKLFLTPSDRQKLLGAGEQPASKFDGLLGLKSVSGSLNS
jgi:phage terminase small subunit